MTTKETIIEDVLDSIIKQLEKIEPNLHLNERYLHHLFSSLIQKDYPISFKKDEGLHPEWATYIDRVEGRIGGCYSYSKEDKSYSVKNKHEKGAKDSGYIDFVLGSPFNPEYAIEFKMSKSFNTEGIIFDYMKLLDPDNHIGKAYSLVVYYGHKSYSTNMKEEQLRVCVEEAIKRIKDKRKDFKDSDIRPHHFYVLELVGEMAAPKPVLFVCTEGTKFERTKQ